MKRTDAGSDTIYVDHIRATVWFAGEDDSVKVTFHNPNSTADSTIIFATIGSTYPDTEIYNWRFAYRFQKDTTVIDTIQIEVQEADTVFFSGYVKNNTGAYSAPFHFYKSFGPLGALPVYQDSTAWLPPQGGRLNGWTPLIDSVYASDDGRVSYNSSGQGRLIADKFKANLPTNVNIVKIAIRTEGYGTGSSASTRRITYYLSKMDSLIVPGETARQDTLNLNTDAQHYRLGNGNAALWGTTWTVSEVNDDRFAIIAYDYNTTANLLALDRIEVKFYYEIPRFNRRKTVMLRSE
jgi:hypothetical protein